jgi:tripartite-type tricarboxylate transporter receptor subunit TctC
MMRMSKNVVWLFLGGLACLLFGTSPSALAEYPERPVTLINPQAPGGAHDAQGRAYAGVVEKYLGKPMMVVNKPGASTLIGTIAVAQAAPDGYTLLLGSSMTTTVVEWEIVRGKVPSVTRQEFVPIGSLTLIPTVVSVPATSPWNSIADLVRDAKAKSGYYAFCSAGLLSPSHLGAELFARTQGLKFRHVPYKGGGPCIAAAVGNQVDFATQFTITTIPLAQGNKLKILAVQSDRRVKAIPDVPTLKELGINAECYMWVGLVAPLKTPAPIIQKLRDATAKAVKDKVFVDTIEKMGGDVHFMDGNELGKFWDHESSDMAKLLAELHKDGLRTE